MSNIINCKDCGHEISKNAQKCPNCGAPVPSKALAGCFGIIAILFIIAIGWSLLFSGGEKVKTEEDYKRDAVIMSQDYVSNYLKNPKDAKFALSRDSKVVQYEKDTYTVASYVDSTNSFGATVRTKYIAVLRKVDDKRWKLESLTFPD